MAVFVGTDELEVVIDALMAERIWELIQELKFQTLNGKHDLINS